MVEGGLKDILSILKLLTTPEQTAIKVKLFIDPQGGFLCFKWNRNRDFVWQSNICSIRILMYQFMRCLWSNRTSLVVLARYDMWGSDENAFSYYSTVLAGCQMGISSRYWGANYNPIVSSILCYGADNDLIAAYVAQRELNAKKCVFGLVLYYIPNKERNDNWIGYIPLMTWRDGSSHNSSSDNFLRRTCINKSLPFRVFTNSLTFEGGLIVCHIKGIYPSRWMERVAGIDVDR